MIIRWTDIHQDDFKTLPVSDTWLQQVRADVVQHLQALIADRGNQAFIRDDYREVADLTMMLLDAGPQQPRFRRPGAYHHARWMSKVGVIC